MSQLKASKTFIVTTVQDGVDGQDAPYYEYSYALSSHATAAANSHPDDINDSDWTPTIPLPTVQKPYVWMRTQYFAGDGSYQGSTYIRLTGEKGAKGEDGTAGKTGLWYDYAGFWPDDVGGLQASVTNTENIGYYVSCRKSTNPDVYGFFMNTLPANKQNTTTPYENGAVGAGWEEMQSDRNYYIAKAYFGDYAQFGSAIINGDWMISRVAISDSPSSDYTDFDPEHPNEPASSVSPGNFIPQYALDMRTGKLYTNDAYLKGTVYASAGEIGGWDVSEHNITSKEGSTYNSKITLCDGYEPTQDGYINTSAYLEASRVLGDPQAGQHKQIARIDPTGVYIGEGKEVSNTTVYPNEIHADGSGWFAGGAITWGTGGITRLDVGDEACNFNFEQLLFDNDSFNLVDPTTVTVDSFKEVLASQNGIYGLKKTRTGNFYTTAGLLFQTGDDWGDGFNQLLISQNFDSSTNWESHTDGVVYFQSRFFNYSGPRTTAKSYTDWTKFFGLDSINGTIHLLASIDPSSTVSVGNNVVLNNTGLYIGSGNTPTTYSEDGIRASLNDGFSISNGDTGNGSSINFMYGTLVLEASSAITANQPITNTSDERLKNIHDEVNASVEDIAGVRVVDYSMKDSDSKQVRLGSIAQDWKKIYPNAIREDEKGFLSMDYASIALAAAVSDAKEIVALKKENEELKARLKAIEEKLGL